MPDDSKQLNLPKREEEVLKLWETEGTFERSLEKTKKGKLFTFFEGPPTANAAPGIHHLESRAFKDIIPRYKTMRGFFVPRKAGWDTHGLPVEIQVEKALGLKTKKDIEAYGIAAFNEKCRESVWQFKEAWEKSTKRIGFWLDLKQPYITYQSEYMESLWWIIKEIWKKGLLYQDFKVIPWCSRCGTGLSTHELGQPGAYRSVKENSVFVKLKIMTTGHTNEYLLVWTTTPWTLSANVAVAVNPKIDYTKFKIGGEYVWSATPPPYGQGEEIGVIEKVSGRSLLGIIYEPLYRIPKEYSLGGTTEYSVIGGDFVSTEDGTGMVHIAPAFGDEDMIAAKKTWGEKYPIFHTVNLDGTMKRGLVGEGKFAKDADAEIVEELKKRGVVYKVKPFEHDYPFCWRCGTALLYFAKNAWWIKMSGFKEKLLQNNATINWVPEHIKEGRFGEFLREVRDWAFSRDRFWGTPLPVWQCEGCGYQDIIGSFGELDAKSGGAKNKYLVMRHGESESNIQNICGAKDGYSLTLKGRTEVEKAIRILKKENIDAIFASPITRTKETAEIVGEFLEKTIHYDARLREINVGDFEGRLDHMYHSYFSSHIEKFTKRPPNGETLSDLRRRMMDFIEEIEKKFSGKKILIVSHEYPIWMLASGSLGWSNEATITAHTGTRADDFIDFAEVQELLYKKLPRDNTGAVNVHRPYSDEFRLPCPKCKKSMKRVSEVVDVWFDSGAMPFAQSHFPFAFEKGSKPKEKLLFPAEYISEAVDQTRGWFYTLLAVSTLLGKGAPYKNVVSLGHVLDKNGQKMSKSKENVVRPDEMIQKYGADTIRWYFYSINAPGEPKKFDEKDLQNKLRGFLGTLWNSFILFETYVSKTKPSASSKNILDRWIVARTNELVSTVSKGLDTYDITGAARAIEEFTIGDFSNWYLRRSRRRFQKSKSAVEKKAATETTAYVLLTLAKLTAPFMPFVAEILWQGLRKHCGFKEKSVHLSGWPKTELRVKNEELRIIKEMKMVRGVVAEALKLRASVGIKVRQPLASLQFPISKLKFQNTKELFSLIREEVNVKEVIDGKELKLDTVITPELKEEGVAREVIRNLQEMRKDLGLEPKNKIRAQFSSSSELEELLSRREKFIKEEAGATLLVFGGKKVFKGEHEVLVDGVTLWIGISRQ